MPKIHLRDLIKFLNYFLLSMFPFKYVIQTLPLDGEKNLTGNK